MESSQIEHEEPDNSGDGTAVCIRCFQPVDPLAHYCPHCGEATGRFTHYIPFVNIPWQARFPTVHGRLESPCNADRVVIQALAGTGATAAPK